jgi:hypothetical protein
MTTPPTLYREPAGADRITPDRFGYWLTLFCERWNRPAPSEPYTREMYRALAAYLTAAEWEVAAAACWRENTFWPSVQDIVAKVTGDRAADLRAQAAFAFDAIRREPCSSWSVQAGRIYSPEAIERTLGPAALRAFQLAGGAGVFRSLTDDNEHWTRRHFADAYVEQAGAEERRQDVGARLLAAGASLDRLLPGRPRNRSADVDRLARRSGLTPLARLLHPGSGFETTEPDAPTDTPTDTPSTAGE